MEERELSYEESRVIDKSTDIAQKLATTFLRDLTLYLAQNAPIADGYYLTQVGIDVAAAKFVEGVILFGAAFATDPELALEKHIKVLRSIFDSNLFGENATGTLKESLKTVKQAVEQAHQEILKMLTAKRPDELLQ